MRQQAFFILLAALLLNGCGRSQQLSIQVNGAKARVVVASTPQQRERGLMHRKRLDPDEGLLMVFPKPRKFSLWMLNTPIPLDAGFFDQHGVLQAVVTMQPDGGKQLYHSPPQTRYALEMNRGWFKQYGLSSGARLVLPHDLSAK